MRKISRRRMIKKTTKSKEYDPFKRKHPVEVRRERSWIDENYVISWWFRGNYYIENGTIYLKESPDYSEKNLYNPAGEETLYLDLVNQDENSEEAILSFVNRYGLLEEHNKDTMRIKAPGFLPSGVYLAPRREPVVFFQAQARAIRFLTELCSLVGSTKRDYQRIRELINLLEAAYGVLNSSAIEMIEQDRDENMVRAAQMYITRLMLHLLQTVRISPEPDYQTGTFSECYRAEGLLPNIYLQIYWMLLGSEVRICANPRCEQKYFEPSRRDQMFHDEYCRRRHQQWEKYHGIR